MVPSVHEQAQVGFVEGDLQRSACGSERFPSYLIETNMRKLHQRVVRSELQLFASEYAHELSRRTFPLVKD